MEAEISNYKDLIDDETWAFIEQTQLWYPPGTTNYSIERQREIYDSMCSVFYRGRSASVKTQDSVLESSEHRVNIRHYSKVSVTSDSRSALLVYFHGGGFVVGSLQSHDDICSEICDRTNCEVVSVDYRLVPEYCHPAAFNDALHAVEHLSENQSLPLILCGDSAGGNLAAAVAHKCRGSAGEIIGQVLIYPTLGGDTTSGSYVTHAQAPMLTTSEVEYYMSLRCGSAIVLNDPYLTPLQDVDFNGLPPTVVISAECDPLSDDGRHYCDHINNTGGQAFWIEEAGLVHGYLRARYTVARAADSFDTMLDWITMLSRRQWPTG